MALRDLISLGYGDLKWSCPPFKPGGTLREGGPRGRIIWRFRPHPRAPLYRWRDVLHSSPQYKFWDSVAATCVSGPAETAVPTTKRVVTLPRRSAGRGKLSWRKPSVDPQWTGKIVTLALPFSSPSGDEYYNSVKQRHVLVEEHDFYCYIPMRARPVDIPPRPSRR